MSERRWDLYVRDMLDCCGKVRDAAAARDYAAFFADPTAYDAVRWNLVILGEAAKKIPKSVGEAHPEIPWGKVIGTRNRIVHGYESVDERVIWLIIHDDIPELMPQLRALLAEAEGQGRADPT